MELGGQDEEEDIGMPISIGYSAIREDPSSSRAKVLMRGNGATLHSTVEETAEETVLVAVESGGSKGKTVVKYQECLKNHAASIGGHAVDGCGEFMPSGEEGTLEALKCAACSCHRNFHRREAQDESATARIAATSNCYYCYNYHKNNSVRKIKGPFNPPPHPPPPQQKFSLGLPSSSPVPQMIMTFGGATDSSSEDLNTTTTTNDNVFRSNASPPIILSKKRFRTKFTQDQKDKMCSFAEKLGWRIQKQEEAAVQQFCAEVGVKREVLKVWMHNNKHTMKKPQ